MSHTPGPWTTRPTSSGGMLVQRGKDGQSLQVYPKADAYLIAVAPEMLANIKQDIDLLGAIDILAVDSKDWDHIRGQIDAMIKEKNALIAKAESPTTNKETK